MRLVAPVALVGLVVLVAAATFFRSESVKASSALSNEPAPANIDGSPTVAD